MNLGLVRGRMAESPMPPEAAVGGVFANRRRRARNPTVPFLAGVQLRMLAVQFLLGTYLALFVSLEALDLVGATVLVLHIVLGFGLLVVSLRMVLAAVRTGVQRGIVWPAVSLLGMIAAFLAGSSFTFAGESDAASFVMAFGFFLGLISDSAILGRPTAAAEFTMAVSNVVAQGTIPKSADR